MSALKGDIWAAARGERAFELAFLPLAGVLFACENAPTVTGFIFQYLRRGSLEQRIAATYASTFFLDNHRDVAILLTERVVLAQEPRLLLQATRETLDIRLDAEGGGKCRRCGLTGGSLSTAKLLAWVPRRVSSKSRR